MTVKVDGWGRRRDFSNNHFQNDRLRDRELLSVRETQREGTRDERFGEEKDKERNTIAQVRKVVYKCWY